MPADDFANDLLPRVFCVFLTSIACSTLAGCVGRVPPMATKTHDSAPLKAGRKFSVPLPDQALLERQPVPNCERKTPEAAPSEPKPPEASPSEPAAAGETGDDDRRRLNLQMDCYRQHE